VFLVLTLDPWSYSRLISVNFVGRINRCMTLWKVRLPSGARSALEPMTFISELVQRRPNDFAFVGFGHV